MYAALVLLVGAVLNNVFLSATINLLSAMSRRVPELQHVVNNIQVLQTAITWTHRRCGVDHFAGTVAGLPLEQAVVISINELVHSDLLPTISKDVDGKLIKNRLLVEFASCVCYTTKMPTTLRLVGSLTSVASNESG